MRIDFPDRVPAFARRVLSMMTLVACASCASAQPSASVASASQSSLYAEVDSLNRAMVAAFNANPAGVARFYADSARIVGPRRSTVRGREAIDRYWANIRKPSEWTLTVVEVGGSRDAVHQVGISRLTSPGRDGKPDTYECDFVVLWRRQADGTLRITLDLYN